MSTPLVEPPAAAPATPSQYSAPDVAAPPSYQPAPSAPAPTAQYPTQAPGLGIGSPAAAPAAAAPASAAPTAAYPTTAYPSAAYESPAPTVADATPTAFGVGAGGFSGFRLEQHQTENPPNNSGLDWAALVLAILLPPIGLITAIVALAVGFRNRGFGSTVAKAAIPIAVVLSLVAGAGGAVLAKTAADNAAHASVVASSAQWCSQVKAGPGGYTSATFGWPSPADNVPDSIKAMQAYVDRWTALQKIAPTGGSPAGAAKTGSGELVAEAKSIVSQDTSTQIVDDATNVSSMEDSATNSGIPQWIANYCQ